ncbi:hypothetical protein [Streptomyces flavofungini]|uniref:hypothetical protein n=1 Tax=Streptomyces flavofungini TaxID=68200 RepID=UPI0025B1967A|nr:hypothetical protein [Streptomyces flavofungini]WJV49889.1 hypothetical protein QUY26_32825 [Streptomyces flavofungini]
MSEHEKPTGASDLRAVPPVGDVVVDVPRNHIVKVTAVNGDVLTVARPSGLAWETQRQDCRPATAAEQRDFEIASRTQAKSKSYTRPLSPLRGDRT